MANETTVQTSCIQENHEADECQENIPPGAIVAAVTSKLKVQVGDVVEYSSIQSTGENEPLSDTCAFSTPAPSSSSGGVKAKSRISGLQSALTPILKNLDIGNKCPLPEPLKDGNDSHLTVPRFSFSNTTANCQKSAEGSSQHPNSDFSCSHSGRSFGDTNASVHWLHDEYLPEMTLLDVTCDSTMQMTKNDSAFPDSVPSTPVTAQSVSTYTALRHSQVSAPTNLKTTAQIPCPQNKTLGLQQSDVSSLKKEHEAADQAHSVSKNTTETSLVMNQSSSAGKTGRSCEVQDVTFDRDSLQKQSGTVTVSETSSSDSWQNTMDKPSPPKVFSAKEKQSQVCPPELSKHNGTTPSKYSNAEMADIPGSIDAPLRWLDDRYFPDITLLDVTRDSEFSPGGEMPSLDVTQDISPVESLQNNMPSSELSGQIVTEPGSLNINQSEDMSSTLDGSATRTISSFSEQSGKCVGENTTKAFLEATRDISMGSVLEDSRPSLGSSGQNMEKIQTSAEGTLGAHPANVTHDISSSSDMSVQVAATQLSTSEVQCNTSAKNVTLELHGEPEVTSNTVGANSEELLTSHDAELTSKVPQASPKRAGSMNSTFDKNSIQKSSGNTIPGEAVATTFCLQNITFETKSPKQNGTITLSETSSTDSHHNTLDKPSPPKVCNATSSPKDNNSEVHPPEQSKHSVTTTITDPDAKMADTPESTFDTNPTVDTASEAGHCETKDHLQSGLPMRDGLSDTLGHHNMDTEDNKGNTLNLDDTLDLRADCLVTSTPMTSCKIMNFYTAQDEGKAMGAQKKLYGDGPSKPGGQAPSDIPSNIVCDRKTFLTQPAAVSLLPPLKAASKLLKCKPASTLSGRFEPQSSGLPMTRQRTQAMMRQKTQSAASDAPHKVGF